MPDVDDPTGTILLVDPASPLPSGLPDGIANIGYRPVSVKSAGACLEALEETDVAGIVSRYELPDLDGIQLLRSIRISYPDLPFILVPENGSESLASTAIAAGVSGYVPRSEAESIVSRLQASINRRLAPAPDTDHERYRHLIEMSPAPINVFDETGESIWCNRALLDLLGLESREQFIGQSIFDVIDPADHDLARRELETVIDVKESTGPTQMRLRPPDRGIRYVRVSTAIGGFLGADVGQAIAIDVTEREERNRQFQILDQWLRHNIRNDMTVIMGLAENIERGEVSDVAETAAQIREQAATLVKQTDQEREIFDILAASADRDPNVIDVSRVIRDQVSACRRRFPDARIDLDVPVDVEVSALPEIGDAVAELIENAILHNDSETPTVEVELSAGSADMRTVHIADNGPGIPATERDSLLLDREIDALNHGSGLGLVLVYWVVRLSGGEITFSESEPRGSVISFTLPPP